MASNKDNYKSFSFCLEIAALTTHSIREYTENHNRNIIGFVMIDYADTITFGF